MKAKHWDFSCDLEVDYKIKEYATIIYSASELQPEKVIRQMSLVDGKLLVHFEAAGARFLRASYSAFGDILALATKTVEEFGQGTKFWLHP